MRRSPERLRYTTYVPERAATTLPFIAAVPAAASGPPSPERFVDLLVLPGGAFPSAVEPHRTTPKRSPAGARVGRKRSLDRSVKRVRSELVEEEAGPSLELRVAIDDGVDETADGVR